MILSHDISFEPEIQVKPGRGWQQDAICFRAEVGGVLEKVVSEMVRLGYSVQNMFAVRLSLEEAIVNGLKHGNHDNPERRVLIRYAIQPDRVFLQVEDGGPGFDPNNVPDPLAPENMESCSGRGLLLMRLHMTSVRFNERGNCVTMCKSRD